MKLYAISDLHLRYEATREALLALPSYPEDWLIVAGDAGETEQHLRFALTFLSRRFAKLLWVPGNHELWTVPAHADEPRGEERYRRMVAVCRELGVLTPEDPYVVWPGDGPRCTLAPLFLLYDYTFRPDDIPVSEAIAWAAEDNLLCSDEVLLHGEGPATWDVLRAAVRRGLDTRIGLEDALWLPGGEAASDNAAMVATAVALGAQ